MAQSFIHIRRNPYEEPYHTQLEITASNGCFCASTDIYLAVADLSVIGNGLLRFSKNLGDEYLFSSGTELADDRFYRYFVLRAYTVDHYGHCAVQIHINQNRQEPDEGMSRFSIQAEAAAVNRLGVLFCTFSRLQHLEFRWTLQNSELFSEYQQIS